MAVLNNAIDRLAGSIYLPRRAFYCVQRVSLLRTRCTSADVDTERGDVCQAKSPPHIYNENLTQPKN